MSSLERPAMKPDFSLLYSDLGLPPDCTLEQFKVACRRRIAELHPDKTGQDPSSIEADPALPALISTYADVSRFHRRYGRMPGAASRTREAGDQKPAGDVLIGERPHLIPGKLARASVPASKDRQRPARPTARLLLAFIALLALLASWDWLTSSAQ